MSARASSSRPAAISACARCAEACAEQPGSPPLGLRRPRRRPPGVRRAARRRHPRQRRERARPPRAVGAASRSARSSSSRPWATKPVRNQYQPSADGQPQRALAVARLERPAQRGVEVLVLAARPRGSQLRQPGPDHVAPDLLGERQVGVAVAARCVLGSPAARRRAERERAHGLQQPIARRVRPRAASASTSAPEQVRPPPPRPRARRSSPGTRRAPQRSLLGRREQVVAPGDRGLERALPPRRARLVPSSREPLRSRRRARAGERAQLRGGELDRQRQPVEAARPRSATVVAGARDRARGRRTAARRRAASSPASGVDALRRPRRSGSRLVPRMRACGSRSERSCAATAATSRSTCSQLSSTSSAGASRSRATMRSIGARGPAPPGPRACARPTPTTRPGVDRAEIDPPHARAATRRRVSAASRVLPTPAGARRVVTSRASRRRGAQRRELGRRGRRSSSRSAAAPARAARQVERRVLHQDHPLERRAAAGPAEAELVGERAARGAVGRERLGLAAGAVQRDHQLPPRPLAQRLGGDGRAQLADAARGGGPGRAAPRRAPRRRRRAAPRAGRARAARGRRRAARAAAVRARARAPRAAAPRRSTASPRLELRRGRRRPAPRSGRRRRRRRRPAARSPGGA